MNKFKLVLFIRVLTVHRTNLLTTLVHALRESDNFLLVLPEQDEGKGNQNAPGQEPSDAPRVAIGLAGRLRRPAAARFLSEDRPRGD